MDAVLQSRWLVAQTQPLCERKATGHIERQGGEVLDPFFYDKARVLRLFPGYLFVHLFGNGAWLRSTIGVIRVLCMGSTPYVIEPHVIENYEMLADPTGILILPDSEEPDSLIGRRVRINGGPMLNRIGIVEGMDAQQRVSVLLSMLGRQSRVDCPMDLLTVV